MEGQSGANKLGMSDAIVHQAEGVEGEVVGRWRLERERVKHET